MALHADLTGIGRHATNEVVAVLHLNEDHLGEILWYPGQFFVGCDQLPPRLWSMSSVLPPVTGNVSARRTRSTVNSAAAAATAAASNAAAANPSAKAALPICQTFARNASGTVPTMSATSPDLTCLARSAAVSASSPASTPPVMKRREAICVTTAPSAATPTSTPMYRVVAVRPAAIPSRCAGTAPCMTFVVSLLRSLAPPPAPPTPGSDP